MKSKTNIIILLFICCLNNIIAQENRVVVIKNVNVIPMTENGVLEHKNVLVSNGKILKITDSISSYGVKPDLIIDGSGKYLIPGLSEMHYHWRNEEGGIIRDFNLLLANGVTTVRNMAEYDWQKQVNHVAIRDSVKKGLLRGPQYYTTGKYLQSGDLTSLEDVNRVMKAHHEKGYDFVKIADNLPKTIYLNVLEQSNNYNIPVIGHAQRELPMEFSLRMKSIEHVEEFVYLFSDEQREDAAFLKHAIQQIKTSEVVVVPTLVVFDYIIQYIDDNQFIKLKSNALGQYMLYGDHNYWLSEDNPYRKDLKGKIIHGKPALDLLQGYYVWMKQFTKMLADADVPLMTGSDTFGFVVPGFSLHEEFQLMQSCGLSPFQILKAATVTPARYLKTFAVEGTVTEGKQANLVLLNKNPLEDIANTETIEGVMLKGTWYDRHALNEFLNQVKSINNHSKTNKQ